MNQIQDDNQWNNIMANQYNMQNQNYGMNYNIINPNQNQMNLNIQNQNQMNLIYKIKNK